MSQYIKEFLRNKDMEQVHSDYLDKCINQIPHLRVSVGVCKMTCFECPCHVTIRVAGGLGEVLDGNVPAKQSQL